MASLLECDPKFPVEDAAMNLPGTSGRADVNDPPAQSEGIEDTSSTAAETLLDLKGKKRAAPEGDTSKSRKSLKTVSSSDAATSSRPVQSEEMIKAQVQCARYAMEQLSLSLLRSHFIMALCDLTRFQLQFYDRSVILVSSSVDIAISEGQELFVVMVWGLRHLSPEDLGFRSTIKDGDRFWRDLAFYYSQVGKDRDNIFSGVIYSTNAGIEYTLGDVIFCQPGLIGRTTLVVNANGPQGPVVLKITSATKSRVSEAEMLRCMRNHAKTLDGGTHWAMNHLPNQHGSVDLPPKEDSIIARVAAFLKGAKYMDNRTFDYEDRVLRIDVYEELHPLKTLTNVGDVIQVFHDILQSKLYLSFLIATMS